MQKTTFVCEGCGAEHGYLNEMEAYEVRLYRGGYRPPVLTTTVHFCIDCLVDADFGTQSWIDGLAFNGDGQLETVHVDDPALDVEWQDASRHPLDPGFVAAVREQVGGIPEPDSDPHLSAEDAATPRDNHRRDAREWRRRGRSISEIRAAIPDNPDTGEAYSKSRIAEWVRDIDPEGSDA